MKNETTSRVTVESAKSFLAEHASLTREVLKRIKTDKRVRKSDLANHLERQIAYRLAVVGKVKVNVLEGDNSTARIYRAN